MRTYNYVLHCTPTFVVMLVIASDTFKIFIMMFTLVFWYIIIKHGKTIMYLLIDAIGVMPWEPDDSQNDDSVNFDEDDDDSNNYPDFNPDYMYKKRMILLMCSIVSRSNQEK